MKLTDETSESARLCTAFEGSRLIASGQLAYVAVKAKKVIDRGERGPVLIFDDRTSQPIEVDFRGNENDVLERLKAAAGQCAGETEPDQQESTGRKPGRPRLGVVAREVTLLPRHWEWLNCQPGGASVALRKLVDEARRVNAGKDRVRQAREAAYRFLSAMAGNEPGFEEATRALFAGNAERFQETIAEWPVDVRDHGKKLAAASFAGFAEIG
jgi:hypothetical protein